MVGAVERHGDARKRRVVGGPDRERVDVEAAPGEEPRHARQHARLVLDEDRENVLAAGVDAGRGVELLEAEWRVGPWFTHGCRLRQPTMSRAAAPGPIIG